MKLSEFQYDLPKELIAQKPLKDRDTSRLMVVDRLAGTIVERSFRDISEYIDKNDALVMNNTRVVPVRLFGKRATGGKVEIFVLNPWEDDTVALVAPSKKVKEGETVFLDCGSSAVVGEKKGAGRSVVFDAPLQSILESGHVPLPPYITREDTDDDKHEYQTVYASKDGATAAPTAGLHFTKELLDNIGSTGTELVYVTLHTGYGTFAPVKEDRIEDHNMHSEFYEIGDGPAEKVNSTKKKKGRIIAVGTTSARVLESAASGEGVVAPTGGETNLFIYPGYKFKIVDNLITNFHLPGSTLLMMVSALAGRELILEAYKKAIEKKFRFFSYGDAMLIL